MHKLFVAYWHQFPDSSSWSPGFQFLEGKPPVTEGDYSSIAVELGRRLNREVRIVIHDWKDLGEFEEMEDG